MHFCLDLCIVNKGEKFYAFLKGENFWSKHFSLVALCMYEFTCSGGVCTCSGGVSICAGGAFLGILLIVLWALLLPMVLSPFASSWRVGILLFLPMVLSPFVSSWKVGICSFSSMVLSPFRFFLKGRRFLELSLASDLFSAYSCFWSLVWASFLFLFCLPFISFVTMCVLSMHSSRGRLRTGWVRGPVDGRFLVWWVIDNVVWTDVSLGLSIAGVECGLVALVQVKNRRERS